MIGPSRPSPVSHDRPRFIPGPYARGRSVHSEGRAANAFTAAAAAIAATANGATGGIRGRPAAFYSNGAVPAAAPVFIGEAGAGTAVIDDDTTAVDYVITVRHADPAVAVNIFRYRCYRRCRRLPRNPDRNATFGAGVGGPCAQTATALSGHVSAVAATKAATDDARSGAGRGGGDSESASASEPPPSS